MKPIPGLRSRMSNIGRSRIRIPEKIDESAARYYLDKHYGAVVSGVNGLWKQRYYSLAKRSKTGSKSSLAKPAKNIASSMPLDVFN